MGKCSKKHNFLTVKIKSEILTKLSKGTSMKCLADEYNVNKSTISRVKKNEEKLRKFILSTEVGFGKRKTLRPPELPKMENALFDWFSRKRSANIPISSEILCEKAKHLHQKIKELPGEFNASHGWLSNFKKRHGIRILKVTGEKLSNQSESVKPFLEKFHTKLKELDLTVDQVYNADESGLFSRLL